MKDGYDKSQFKANTQWLFLSKSLIEQPTFYGKSRNPFFEEIKQYEEKVNARVKI